MPVQHWQNVVFSDESRFLFYRVDGRIRVRRMVNERPANDIEQPYVQAGGGGVTVWGAFHHGAKSPLVVLNGNLNQDGYLDILRDEMLPFARRTLGRNFVYQDDNAPAHRARRVDAFLNGQRVNRMMWPAYSPDMNPIENLWADVTRGLNLLQNPPDTIQQLQAAIRNVWDNIPVQTLNNLAQSMPQRLRALIRANGGTTKY